MSETEEEHVARAIYESRGYLYASRGPYGRWAEALDASRAAIAAVREHEARAAESVGELKYTGAATVLSVSVAESMAVIAAEAMRDRCEAIADEEVDRCTREGRSELPAFRIRDAIATLANRATKRGGESWPEGQTLRAQEETRRSVLAGDANLQAEIERLTKANKQLTVDLESTRGEIARHTALFRQKEAECERLQLAAAPTRLKRRPAPKRKPAVRRPKAVKGSRR